MVIIMIKIIKDILTDENFIGAILTSLSFIFIGFVLRRKNIINNNGKEFLTIIVLKNSFARNGIFGLYDRV